MSEEEMFKQHAKMYVDFYLGDGKDNPPMTVRMDRVETALSAVIYYARWLLGVGALIAVGLIVNVVKR